MEFILANRDFDDDDDYDDDNDGSWWYGPRAAAIKWSIIAVIFLIALLWFFGGYYHAQRRLKKGLQPLAYHRWLLRRSQRDRIQPPNQFSFYQQNRYDEGYQMEGYPAPPPAYNPAFAPPPTYQPSTKVDPSQDWAAPPPGPPPTSESSTAAQQTSPSPIYDPQNTTPDVNLEVHPTPSAKPPKRSLFGRLNPFK